MENMANVSLAKEKQQIGEHGPGPPGSLHENRTPNMAATRNADAEDDLGKELIRKEQELQRLRTEVQAYVMKIRGYQTLENLLHESKRECASYRQKMEEMSQELDQLRKTSDRRTTDEPSLSDDKSLDFRECGAAGSPKKTMSGDDDDAGKVRTGSSTASSPSFVRIDSSSIEHSLASGELQQDEQMMNSLTDTRCVSVDVDHLAELLRNGGDENGKGGVNIQDISSNLMRASIDVRKLEKQAKAQKVLVKQLKAENEKLSIENSFKQKELNQLMSEYEKQVALVKNLEMARDQAMLEARTKYMESGTENLEQRNEQISAEWVELVQQTSTGDGAVQITTVSTVEMELRKRIEKLNATISELVTVNRTWDEHCRKLQQAHEQQTAALQSEIDNTHYKLEQKIQEAERQQLEYEQILLNSKKLREADEMAKDEALDQLHREKRQQAELEQKCIEFSRKTAELEARLQQLQISSQAAPGIGFPGFQILSPPSSSTRSQDADVQVLREQVKVFKEDFDQERRDREAARTELEATKMKLNEAKIQLDVLQKSMMSNNHALQKSQAENMELRRQFQKMASDLRLLQAQGRVQPSASHRSPSHVPGLGVVAQPQIYQPPRVSYNSRWSCTTCTFLNPEERSSCEMCGRVRQNDMLLQPRSVSSSNDMAGPAAGLQGWQPPTTSSWPYLANTNLETDQPPHSSA